jgi:hypothetical protein
MPRLNPHSPGGISSRPHPAGAANEAHVERVRDGRAQERRLTLAASAFCAPGRRLGDLGGPQAFPTWTFWAHIGGMSSLHGAHLPFLRAQPAHGAPMDARKSTSTLDGRPFSEMGANDDFAHEGNHLPIRGACARPLWYWVVPNPLPIIYAHVIFGSDLVLRGCLMPKVDSESTLVACAKWWDGRAPQARLPARGGRGQFQEPVDTTRVGFDPPVRDAAVSREVSNRTGRGAPGIRPEIRCARLELSDDGAVGLSEVPPELCSRLHDWLCV